MNKLRIAFVVEAMLGGIRQHVCDIIQNLEKEEYDIYLIYSDIRADGKFYMLRPELEQEGVHLIQCNEMRREISKWDLKAYKRLVKIFKEIRPDIVHCHSSKAGVVGRMAARRCCIKKIVYTPHSYAFLSPDISVLNKGLYVAAEIFLSRFMTTKTINVSQGEMNLALNYHLDRSDKFVLIYNGIEEKDTSKINKGIIRKQLGITENKVLIGVTARCAKQKDPMTFLQIAATALKGNDNLEFIYIGDGPLEGEMREWIDEWRLGNKIHMLGFRPDAADIVGELDIYLSTALYEGLPYSMLEAMRAGVPIIATDVVGNNELVKVGKNGLLFKAGSIAGGVAAIRTQVEQMVIRSDEVVATFLEKFSLEKMKGDVVKIYRGGVLALYSIDSCCQEDCCERGAA